MNSFEGKVPERNAVTVEPLFQKHNSYLAALYNLIRPPKADTFSYEEKGK
jgi:hypothetical protein